MAAFYRKNWCYVPKTRHVTAGLRSARRYRSSGLRFELLFWLERKQLKTWPHCRRW